MFVIVRFRLKRVLRVVAFASDLHGNKDDWTVAGDEQGVAEDICELVLWFVDDSERCETGEVCVFSRDFAADG